MDSRGFPKLIQEKEEQQKSLHKEDLWEGYGMAMGPTLSQKESEDMMEDEYCKNGRARGWKVSIRLE